MVVYNVHINYDDFETNEEYARFVRPLFFSTIERNIYFKDYKDVEKISILVEGVCDKDIPFEVKDVLDKFPLHIFMGVCDQLPDANKNEHVLEVMAIPLHRPPMPTPRPTPRPSFMRSMYRRLTHRRSRSTRTDPPEITPEAYRKWYMKSCVLFIKGDTDFLLFIDKDVLLDKEFAKLAVDEKVDITMGNDHLKMDKYLTDKELDKIKSDIFLLYAELIQHIPQIKVFVHHYLAIRLKDRINLHTASRGGLVTRKTRFSNAISNARVISFLGGNSRQKRKRTKRLLR
jgi:hypothetical protein